MSVEFSTKLLEWYHQERRLLPWRSSNPDPYRVWISEIMLQQTTFATVEGRFHEFIACFPDVKTLAQATQAEVLQHWAGLGYYARARNLHRCAQVIVEQYLGKFPETREELLRLPGIGAYTAAAILAIAFDQPTAAVDSNVKRLFARVMRKQTPIKDNDPEIKDFMAFSRGKFSPREHLEALMDLGELICTARHPNCTQCPVQTFCAGKDIAKQLPKKPSKQPRKNLYAYAYVLTNNHGQVWLRRRAQQGLLAGMLEIPTSTWHQEDFEQEDILPDVTWQDTTRTIHHLFTHIALEVRVLEAQTSSLLSIDSFGLESGWYDMKNPSEIGLPSLMKKILLATRTAE